MNGAFVNCKNLFIADDAGIPDLSNVTDMLSMFTSANFTGELNNWDISNVENMNQMFFRSNFNGDISKWDISSLKFASNMFSVNTSMSSENY
ncbi:MAG: BspA family leucine-rich repeat surface protein, partial [Ekhidna sp.]|nr:BspA family leucine-rich repeat surface protein [Ekhidna sp.]